MQRNFSLTQRDSIAVLSTGLRPTPSSRLSQLARFARLTSIFCLGAFGVVGLAAIALDQYRVNAVEVVTSPTGSDNASSGNIWRYASFPVENFQGYTSPFGYRQSATGGSGQEFHYGLDFAAPEGSYIRNWWTGRVVEVSDDSNCGTSVVVQSGAWEHIYCHMQGRVEVMNGQRYMVDRTGGVQIAEGQQLPAGARIGRVGMTGRTTGPHLHWGLKYSSQWVDPAVVLRAMYVAQTGENTISTRP